MLGVVVKVRCLAQAALRPWDMRALMESRAVGEREAQRRRRAADLAGERTPRPARARVAAAAVRVSALMG